MMKARVFLSLLVVLLMATSARADLRAYWAFEEGSGDYAYDSSGNANHGLLYADTEAGWDEDNNVPLETLTGTTKPYWISDYGTRDNYSLLFSTPDPGSEEEDNWNSVLVAKSDSIKDLGETWSLALWIRQDSRKTTPGGGSQYPRMISCPNYELELGVAGWEYDYFWPYGNGALQTDIGTSYIGAGGSLEQWYHMAVTYDGTNLRKYLNGTLVPDSVKNIPNQLLTNIWDTEGWANALLKLGTQTWPAKDWFIGAMDDVCIWGDEYLTQEDVTALVDGTYPLPEPIVPEPGTLVLLICGAIGCLLIRRR